MRRIPRAPVGGGTVPESFEPQTGPRSLFEPLLMADGTESGCWSCSDAPCSRFSPEEIGRQFEPYIGFSPEPRVCPTDSIVPDQRGVPLINETTCIGCGLCVVRCPVGAIHLSRQTAAAVVGPLVDGDRASLEELQRGRENAQRRIVNEVPPFSDSGRVQSQVERTIDRLGRAEAPKAYRLLVRNAFLVDGTAARMSNRGANYDWAEVVAVGTAALDSKRDGRNLTAVVQIEPGVTSLDAHRRLLAGVAIAVARLGIDGKNILPVVVVPLQPNGRTDYYRVLSDVRKYLGIRIRTVPLAVIYLAIRDRHRTLIELLKDGAFVDSDNPSNSDWVAAAFGGAVSGVRGISPGK